MATREQLAATRVYDTAYLRRWDRRGELEMFRVVPCIEWVLLKAEANAMANRLGEIHAATEDEELVGEIVRARRMLEIIRRVEEVCDE